MRLILAALLLAGFGASCDRLLPFGGAPPDGALPRELWPPRGDGRPDLSSADRLLTRELSSKKDILPETDWSGQPPDGTAPLTFQPQFTFRSADLPVQVKVPSGASLLLVQVASLGPMPPAQVTFGGTLLKSHMTGGNGSFATTWHLADPPAGSAALEIVASAGVVFLGRVSFVSHGAYYLGGGGHGDGPSLTTTLPAACDLLLDVLLTYPATSAIPGTGQVLSAQATASPMGAAWSAKWKGQWSSWTLAPSVHWVLDVACLTVKP